MPFADEFINAFLAGQQARESKQLHEHRTRQMQYEAEDRDVETKLLRHRLSELKLTERLKAREAAQANLQALSGMPTAQVPSSALEEALPPQYQGGGIEDQQGASPFQMRPQTIPGIPGDLLGGVDIPDIQVRPQTLEDQLAQLFAQKKIEASTQFHNVTRGGKLLQGDRVVAEGESVQPADPLVALTNRDAGGTETTTYKRRSEVPSGTTTTRARLPQRTSAAATASKEEVDAIVEGIQTGRRSSDLSGYVGRDRRAIETKLLASGFNMKAEQADTKALAAHFQAMNSGVPVQMQLAAETANTALDDLEAINNTWDRATYGPFSWLSIASNKLKGGKAAEDAKDAEEAVRSVVEALGGIKAGGSPGVNQQISDAEKVLSTTQSKTDLGAAIKRLRRSVSYRTSAIRNLGAILPSAAGTGKADFEWDPVKGELVPVK